MSYQHRVSLEFAERLYRLEKLEIDELSSTTDEDSLDFEDYRCQWESMLCNYRPNGFPLMTEFAASKLENM